MKIKGKTTRLILYVFIVSLFLSIFSIAQVRAAPLSYNYKTSLPEEKSFVPNNAFHTDLFTGAATYEYGLKVPPGTNELQPKVSVLYNSHAASSRPGVVGAGWTLTALSYVAREVNGTLMYTGDDEFQLVLEGNVYKVVYIPAENRYHTNPESFLFINKLAGGNNQKGEHWIVRTKDGTTYRFGYNATAESIASENTNMVWRWYLDLVSDTYGNNITYFYKKNPFPQDLNATYLDRIEYNNDKKRVVNFVYEAGNRPDLRVIFGNGQMLKETRRIQEVNMTADGLLVRKYAFNYTQSATETPAQSFLNSITEQGSDGTTALPPVDFDYYPPNKTWTASPQWSIPDCEDSEIRGCIVTGSGEDKGIRFIDVDRNGFIDIVRSRFETGGNPSVVKGVWINTGTSFVASGWDLPDCTGGAVTYGCIILQDSSGIHDTGVRLADVDGDGFTDIVRGRQGSAPPSQGPSKVYLNNPSLGGWYADTSWEIPECHDYSPATHRGCFTTSDVDGYNDNGVRFADVNGDGLLDILRGRGGLTNEAASKVFLHYGHGWRENTSWVLPECHEYWSPGEPADYKSCFVRNDYADNGVRLEDVNGDGLADLLVAYVDPFTSEGYAKAWINNGKGWSEDAIWRAPHCEGTTLDGCFVGGSGEDNSVRLVDLNGDGLVDIIKAKIRGDNNGNQTVYMNTGYGWRFDASWKLVGCADHPDTKKCFLKANGQDNGVRLIDVNGDGLADAVDTKDNTPTATQARHLNMARKAGLLLNVTQSYGGKTAIEYDASTKFWNKGNDTHVDLGFPLWVVTSLNQSNEMKNAQQVKTTITYNYTNGLYEYAKQEFRGFERVVENQSRLVAVQHVFHQDEGRQGRERTTETFNATENQFQRREFFWNAALKENRYHVVELREESTATFDGVSSNPRIENTSYTYDDYGNILYRRSKGDVELSNDDRHEYFEYVNNTSKWIVETVKRYVLYEADNATKVRETRYSYDGVSYGDPPTKGDISKEEKILDGGANPIALFAYDSYGNLINRTDANSRSTLFSFGSSDPTFTYPDSSTNAKNHITKTFYDLGTGNLKSTVDPNGFITNYTYDVFGRITAEIRPYDSFTYPTKVYAYELDGAPPEEMQISQREENGTVNTYDTYTFYDGLENVVQIKTEGENNNQIVDDAYYDPLFRIAAKSNRYLVNFDGNYTTPSAVAQTRIAYDPLHRMTALTNADNTTQRFVHDRWNTTTFDENNNKKITAKDAHDQIVEVTEFNPGANRTKYTYTAAGNLMQIIDTDSNRFKFFFDSLGRRTSMVDPDLGQWNYTYDNVGNLLTSIDQRGITTTYTYDELNRATRKATPTESIGYIYDLLTLGTLTNIGGVGWSINYTYDNRLRKVAEKKSIDGEADTSIFVYDAMDRVQRHAFANSGRTSNYTYSNQALISSIAGITTAASHNEVGKVLNRTYANSEKTVHVYDPLLFRLQRIRTDVKQDLNYTYNKISDVIKIQDFAHNRTYTMFYDALSRLLSAVRDDSGNTTFAFNYSYNSIGNALNVTSTNENMTFFYNKTMLHAPHKALVDRAVVVESLQAPAQNGLNIIFEFAIRNTDNVPQSNVLWSLHTGERTIDAEQPVTLGFNETVLVYAAYDYAAGGTYIVTAEASTPLTTDARSMTLTVSGGDV